MTDLDALAANIGVISALVRGGTTSRLANAIAQEREPRGSGPTERSSGGPSDSTGEAAVSLAEGWATPIADATEALAREAARLVRKIESRARPDHVPLAQRAPDDPERILIFKANERVGIGCCDRCAEAGPSKLHTGKEGNRLRGVNLGRPDVYAGGRGEELAPVTRRLCAAHYAAWSRWLAAHDVRADGHTPDEADYARWETQGDGTKGRDPQQ